MGPRAGASAPATTSDLRVLFHQLNNQLGIILAHAELLEAKAAEDAQRARAAQVVAAAIEAMSVTRRLFEQITPV